MHALSHPEDPGAPQTSIPDHLPGEPPPRALHPLSILGQLGRKLAVLGMMSVLSLPFWPLYLVLRLVLPRPPIIPSVGRYLRTMRRVLLEQPAAPGLTGLARATLALSLLARGVATPFRGLAWYLDDLLYGRALARVGIVEPLFEISAARSGSTQLARYLEDDPHISAPSLMQASFPYLWLWKLAPRTLGRLMTLEQARERVMSTFPEVYLQRHEMEPFRTDTFELIFLMAHQLFDLRLSLGPDLWIEDISASTIEPSTRELWEDFVRFIDAIGRKTLLHAAQEPGTPPQRLMIKGHFLAVAPALEARYPDARFLTVLRTPEKRLQSIINFHRCAGTDALCGPVPWPWLIEHALRSEVDYCEVELEWFQRADGARRCVVRFDEYVRDLEGTMRRVYLECLDREILPPHVPRTHAHRVRSHYSIDRSLAQLGIDVGWLNQRLEAYRRWATGDGRG